MNNLANERVLHNPQLSPPPVIHVSTFQPFNSRLGRDTVLRLDFRYDSALVGQLKQFLRTYKAEAVDLARHCHTSGGWLPEHKCWFIELAIWPVLKLELQYLGYRIEELGHG